jgi:diguanylate cyclase (GGDEF)-like protein
LGGGPWPAIGGVDDELAGYIVGMRDIDDEDLARTALTHALAHDPLTGLATLPTAIKRIDELLAEIPRDGPRSWVGVLCIGVDSLRAVNEAITHSAGDLVLATLATRLADVQDDSDLLARGSGDEFIAILPGLSSGADAGALAEHIRLSTHGPITIGSTHFEPTVSIGIATGTIGSQGEALVHDASLAMHQAKDNGRDRCEFFLDSLAEEAQHRVQVEDGVRDGLLRGEFVPWFQPIVDSTMAASLAQALTMDQERAHRGGARRFPTSCERTSLIVGLTCPCWPRLPRPEYLASAAARCGERLGGNVGTPGMRGRCCVSWSWRAQTRIGSTSSSPKRPCSPPKRPRASGRTWRCWPTPASSGTWTISAPATPPLPTCEIFRSLA